MNRLKHIAVLIGSLFFLGSALAQNDTCRLRVTLLTCAPGEELYSTFGHTAIGVQDGNSGSDMVFNYGSFEFSPDFYARFIRGKLLYYLSVEAYPEFIYQYQYESRSVVEQEVQLTCAEQENLLQALLNNARVENRYYRYDFLFDNCTTRAGDMIARYSADSVQFRNILPEKTPSFRDLIHTYLDRGKQPWSKLGIDILLGAKLDRKVTNREAMFLPDYLLKGFDSATISGRKLVTPPQAVLSMPSPLADGFVFPPLLCFALVFLLALVLSFSRRKGLQKALGFFDFVLFFLLGLSGLLLLFMWFGTDHIVCRNNLNLAWALPTHLAAAVFAGRKAAAVRAYFRFTAWLSAALLLAWFFLPQELNPALIPLVLTILLRSWQLSKSTHHGTKNAGNQRN